MNTLYSVATILGIAAVTWWATIHVLNERAYRHSLKRHEDGRSAEVRRLEDIAFWRARFWGRPPGPERNVAVDMLALLGAPVDPAEVRWFDSSAGPVPMLVGRRESLRSGAAVAGEPGRFQVRSWDGEVIMEWSG